MQLIVPHVRRAAVIGKLVDLHKIEAATFADTLDGLAAAVFLVDSDGRIMYANSTAQTMLHESSVIRGTSGKLTVLDSRADHALRDILINADGGAAATGTKGIAISIRAAGNQLYVAHILPLASGARRNAGIVYSAIAAIFVRKAELNLTHPLKTVANTYKLTPAEMRVLMTIVEFDGVREAAPVLGISVPIVKTHLQHVFEKTGTSRQVDLVKMVASHMGPLRS